MKENVEIFKDPWSNKTGLSDRELKENEERTFVIEHAQDRDYKPSKNQPGYLSTVIITMSKEFQKEYGFRRAIFGIVTIEEEGLMYSAYVGIDNKTYNPSTNLESKIENSVYKILYELNDLLDNNKLTEDEKTGLLFNYKLALVSIACLIINIEKTGQNTLGDIIFHTNDILEFQVVYDLF